MHNIEQLGKKFAEHFDRDHFPSTPATLYDPDRYFLSLGGKRIRPLLVLMGNELFDDIKPDAWHVATAIELFHNFTLIHDDIMDAAAFRRGRPTVHEKYGNNTAILSGDVMLVKAYDYLNELSRDISRPVVAMFNKTAMQVCEGQQLDVDFEKQEDVSIENYIEMIRLKTSVLIAASLRMGAIIGGAGRGNQDLLYSFGENLGIAFQIQDDYLDAFGDPSKFGKEPGGDITQNKKTILAIRTRDEATKSDREQLANLARENPPQKVEMVLDMMRKYGVDIWALQQRNTYFEKAMKNLEDVAVVSNRKHILRELAGFLIQRDH
jgi:geranylgeranyl diphosphate synthase type II